MNVITIESDAYNEIIKSIQSIDKKLDTLQNVNSNEVRWLNNTEARKVVNLSTRTMASKRYSGEIPYTKFGRRILYKMSDLQAYLEKHYQKAFKN